MWNEWLTADWKLITAQKNNPQSRIIINHIRYTECQINNIWMFIP